MLVAFMIVTIIIVLFLLYIGLGFWFIARLTGPYEESSEETPSTYGFVYESVHLNQRDAWHIKVPGSRTTIVTVPALGSTELKLQGNTMDPFWKALTDKGYSILSLPSYDDVTVLRAVEHLRKDEEQNVVLHGFSIGASVALYVAAQTPVEAVIADGVADDLIDAMLTEFGQNSVMKWLVPSFRICMSFTKRMNMDSLHALRVMPAVHCPVLLVFADREPIQLQRLNVGLVESAKSATNVEVMLLSNEKHCFAATEQSEEYVDGLADFLHRMAL